LKNHIFYDFSRIFWHFSLWSPFDSPAAKRQIRVPSPMLSLPSPDFGGGNLPLVEMRGIVLAFCKARGSSPTARIPALGA